MSFDVRLSPTAARQLAALPEKHRRLMLHRLKALRSWPDHGLDVRALRGDLKGHHRLRSGAYRALLTVIGSEQTIMVERVGARQS